jgi:hypothetical protein
VDIDGDGEIDLLGVSGGASGLSGDLLAWYRNDGTPFVGAWTGYQIDNTREPSSASAAHLDGNTDLDVVAAGTSAGGDWVGWYENDGTPAGLGDWTFHSIATAVGSSVFVLAADIDGDLDNDVVTADSANATVAWYENKGTGLFGTAQIISNTAIGAFWHETVDLDQDGDIDVVASHGAANPSPIGWYENDGTPGGLGDWDFHAIETTAGSASGLDVADLDSDCDLDVVTPLNGSSFVWYKNESEPDTDGDGVPNLIDNCDDTVNVAQRDTDGDGYGNACDADLNNDDVINFSDLGLLKSVFFSTDADADFNGDGAVNFGDLGIMKSMFFGPPGPMDGC